MALGSTSRTSTERILCPRCRAANRAEANFCMRCGTSLLLGGLYRIVAVIKEGGMGTVYRAIDQNERAYALKELRDEFTDPQERETGIRRFLDEGELLHSLRDHPAIPKVYRSFVDNGRYYLAMEFIHGDDLEDLLRRHGRFTEAQVLVWADQLCDVLQYLHDNHLIYRDMKPSNVMIARDGHVKVVDFGLAQLLRPGVRGTIFGTPGYAPPEQYQGMTTPQSDVYSLAATLHHMLTGRDPREQPPFSFPPAHTLDPRISRATSDALQKALQQEIHYRFPTMEAFRQALQLGATRGIEPSRTRTIDRSPPRTRTIDPSSPPVRAPTQPQTRSAGSTSQQRRRSFRARVRRVVLAALIGASLFYTAPEWAPALGSTINNVVQQIIEQLDENWNPDIPQRDDTSAPVGVLASPIPGYELPSWVESLSPDAHRNGIG